MKKILLPFMFVCAFAGAKAQGVVLNEVYGNPNGTNSEFVELYNSSVLESLDCYTMLTYFEDEGGTNKGWYVLDFPSTAIIGVLPGFFTLGPANIISVQGTPNVPMNLNWNDATFRGGGTSGYLQKWLQTGGTNATATYTQDGTFTNATNVVNLLDGTLNGSQFYFTLLYKNGILLNAFVGGGSNATLSSYNIPLGTLNITPSGAGCSGVFNAFGALQPAEFWNPSGGSDNGYARSCNGRCGSWFKTSNQLNHTPGTSNNITAGGCTLGEIATTESLSCGATPRFVLFDVTGLGTSSATEADDFPIRVSAYADANLSGALDIGDILINPTPKLQNTVASPSDTIQLPVAYQNFQILVAYRTKRGCFDKIVKLVNGCLPLPVNFKTFTATRVSSNVLVKWETAWEQNNSGFAVERNINGVWVQVAWVASLSPNGHSDIPLSYSYVDQNNLKGISQYRIRQVDFDTKSTYSVIRSVRGEGQLGKTIVYPNPTNNGKVNVVFDDAKVTREVSVSDMSGRMIRQIRGITTNNITIENLQPGVYTIRIVAIETGEQGVEKVVVNKQ